MAAFRSIWIATLFLAAPFFVRADVALPSLFSDGMVLQQGIAVPVWGTAMPGEKVAVTFGNQILETAADPSGKWMVRLEPLKKTSVSSRLTIKGKNQIVINDVLVGEVWLCSGQSNMAFILDNAHNASEAIPKANHPLIRFCQVGSDIAFSANDEVRAKWVACTPESAAKFSAVGYFFGEQIAKSQDTPVGLIGSYLGGTPAEAWTSIEALEAVPELAHYARTFQGTKANLKKLKEIYENETLPKWEAEMEAWKAGPGASATGKAARGPKKPTAPDKDRDLPTVLFNGRIAPLIPYAIRGVIWYQGEGNVKDAVEYATLFPTMIRDWRARWGEGDFPFLFVQLSSYGSSDQLPVLRQSQLKTLALPKTGMAVSFDIGDNLHPENKVDVGRRLAKAARSVAYGEELVFSGPIFKAMTVENGKARVSFDHVGGGLIIGQAPPLRLNEPPRKQLDHLNGFEIAAEDGRFVPAKAHIEGDEVIVWSDSIPAPRAVRYAWQAAPEANLYNKEDLPASPFTSINSN